MYFLFFFLQFMRHQRQNLPAWMRLTMALFGFLFPRDALFPRLRGEQRWRDFLLVLASAPCFPPNPTWGSKGPDFWGGTVRWNTGLDFLFSNWIWRRDEENTGHRWTEANYRFFSFFCWLSFCFFRLSEKEPLRLKRYFRNICKITYFVQ